MWGEAGREEMKGKSGENKDDGDDEKIEDEVR